MTQAVNQFGLFQKGSSSQSSGKFIIEKSTLGYSLPNCFKEDEK
jgi:hypothetical protein